MEWVDNFSLERILVEIVDTYHGDISMYLLTTINSRDEFCGEFSTGYSPVNS